MDIKIKSININNGIEGVLADINELNFLDAVYCLHKFFGISYKAISKHADIGYSTLRVMVSKESVEISEKKLKKAITNLKEVYSIVKIYR